MYKYMNQMLSDIFNNFFTFNYNIHKYFSRQYENIHVQKANVSSLQKKLYELLVCLFGMNCLMLLTITVHYLFINVVSKNIYYLKH